jgi:voltage-gated potassium channel
MTGTSRVEMRGTAYELFLCLLTVLSIINLAVIILPITSGAGKQVILAVEVCLTPIFLADFLLRLATTRSRREYLLHGWGWADLVAVVPLLRVVRIAHVAAVVRALRSRGPGSVFEELSVERAAATFFLTIYLVIVVLEAAGALVLDAEAGAAGANIRTPGDALWWGYVTITTVGYGDQYPVTAWGRVIGVFLLTAGVALFSVFTGFIANAFLAPRRRRRRLDAPAEAGTALAELEAIRGLLDEQEDRAVTLRARLDSLERALVTASPEAVLPVPSGEGPTGPGGA